ncbi:MAG TPA: choice-of-anchor Q domain-containing protein [Solirubrobacteraceae bacterium]|nr:choice-of-anchor Q domain-containing protein [Solirubrobacteraceae bacterium]
MGVRAALMMAVLAAFAGLAFCALAASASAATYTVGTVKDVLGTCASPSSGKCSLRQLIEYEDHLPTTPEPTDTLVVPAGTYSLANGELLVTQSLTIAGAGARSAHIKQASVQRPVFDVHAPTEGAAPTVTISGLEISGGEAGPGNGFFGGDVYSSGKLALEEDWITEGTASSGGGVSNDGGTLALVRSLVSGNHASTGGGDSGGIQNHGTAECFDGCFPGKKATLEVEDSTVANNDARLGAGIFSWSEGGVEDGNEVRVLDSTIAENSTHSESSGGALGPGAGLLIADGTAEVAGSIVAFNSEITETFSESNCATEGSGRIVSAGYNLTNGEDCGFRSAGDLQNTFPSFGSSEPQNNGGATNTLALEPTSAGVDAIPTSRPFCGGLDQRGISRPQGAGCDMGAVELVPFTIEPTEGAHFSHKLTTARCSIFGTPTIEWGDGSKSEATVHESTISGSHTYAEEGTYNAAVTYGDDCGTHRFPFQAKVADAALTATAEPVNATAGTQFSGAVAKFSDADPGGIVEDYTASIEWGDGSSTTGTVTAIAGGFTVSGTHTFAASGEYPTSITITDAGGAKAIATGKADIKPIEAIEGEPFSADLATACCGLLDTPTIAWGDDQTSEATVHESTISGTHTYTEEGTYNGSVSYEYYCGDSCTQEVTFQVKVVDAALTAVADPVSAAAGALFAGAVAKFTDANPAGTVSDYTASIEWGDGSHTTGTIATAVGGFTVSGAHTYAAAGAYPTSVTITDTGGASATATGSANVAPPAGAPKVSEVTVASVTQTSATIEFTIDPDGAETSYVIDYGPGTEYGQHTEPVAIGATGGLRRIQRTLMGLAPGSTYHFDVVATNSQASTGVASEDQHFTTEGSPGAGNPGSSSGKGGVSGFQSSAPAKLTLADLPPPVLGSTVNVEPVKGTVLVALAPLTYASIAGPLQSAFASISKGLHFIPLTEARQIPVGSVLETTAGVARLQTATASVGKLQSGEFGAGIFKLLQNRKQKGLTELNLIDNHSARQACATVGKKAAVAAKRLSSKVLGRLTGSAHGQFTTRGQYSAATVRGTVWGVQNRCDGTLTRVVRGKVTVRDFRRRKTITLFTGQTYLAKAP